MALTGIPISEEQCIGESLPTINNAFIELDRRLSEGEITNNLYTNLSGTYVQRTAADGLYVPQPPTNSNGDLLVYEHNSRKWYGDSFFRLLTAVIGPGITVNSGTYKIEAASVPTGAIMTFPTLTIPSGWVACNGQGLDKNIITNQALFNLIGYTFGGSGSTFKVIDLRGHFIRGWDDNRGIDPNRALGSTQQDDIKSHTHAFLWGQQAGTGSSPTAGNTVTNFNFKADITGDHINNTGGSETRPINTALIHCIKL